MQVNCKEIFLEVTTMEFLDQIQAFIEKIVAMIQEIIASIQQK